MKRVHRASLDLLKDVSIPVNLYEVTTRGRLSLTAELYTQPLFRGLPHREVELPPEAHCSPPRLPTPDFCCAWVFDDREHQWPRQFNPAALRTSYSDLDLEVKPKLYRIPNLYPAPHTTKTPYEWLFSESPKRFERLRRECFVSREVAALALDPTSKPEFLRYGFGFPQAQTVETHVAIVATALTLDNSELHSVQVTRFQMQRLLDSIAVERAMTGSRVPFLLSLRASAAFKEQPRASRKNPGCASCGCLPKPWLIKRMPGFFDCLRNLRPGC